MCKAKQAAKKCRIYYDGIIAREWIWMKWAPWQVQSHFYIFFHIFIGNGCCCSSNTTQKKRIKKINAKATLHSY